MVQFFWPWAFFLLPLPILARFAPGAKSRNLTPALKVPFFDAVQRVDDAVGITFSRPVGRRNLLMWSVWVLLVIAFARPMWIGTPLMVSSAARDMMLAVDLSGSMDHEDFAITGLLERKPPRRTRTNPKTGLEEDLPYNRLDAVKVVVEKFIKRRTGDKIGLIVFADRALLLAPLTFDRDAVNDILQDSNIGLVGYSTAIGDAIGLTVKYMKDRETNNKVLVLLTDGSNQGGVMTPEHAVKLAQKMGLKVYTIGIGARPKAGDGLAKSEEDAIDEKSLDFIARATGGRFFRASSTSELDGIYDEVDALEPIPMPVFLSIAEDRFYIPLVIAMLLLVWTLFSSVGGLRHGD